jgi:hypothetical protein
MDIKIKFRFGKNGYADRRLVILTFIVTFTSLMMMHLENLFQNSRESIFPSSKPNGTLSSVLLQCSIPYDECRCSVLSNRSDSSIKCITDVEAMTGHVLPLVLYGLQLYLIREFFSFKGSYAFIFIDIFRITAFGVFAEIATMAHGSSCFHFYTCVTICSTGICLSGFIFYQIFHTDRKYFSRKIHDISQDQRLVIRNQNRETRITIPIS